MLDENLLSATIKSFEADEAFAIANLEKLLTNEHIGNESDVLFAIKKWTKKAVGARDCIAKLNKLGSKKKGKKQIIKD